MLLFCIQYRDNVCILNNLRQRYSCKFVFRQGVQSDMRSKYQESEMLLINDILDIPYICDSKPWINQDSHYVLNNVYHWLLQNWVKVQVYDCADGTVGGNNYKHYFVRMILCNTQMKHCVHISIHLNTWISYIIVVISLSTIILQVNTCIMIRHLSVWYAI